MIFNPDPNKQAQAVIFSWKLNKPNDPLLNFNNTVVIQSTNHKHLGIILDTKLDFQEHLKDKLSRISKAIGLLRKLPHNSSFHQNLEKNQYNSALAITGAIRGTSKENLYQELGLESLSKKAMVSETLLFL